ncbi:hypothetical protein L914_08139 [Phytophthora nicotianae]|uniref:RING-type domain-containing protein n=1 Tax=Phytophthora nicotianae TaxID=4792 RepID=W2NGM4_PHYNI|nr:hypothetical protein L914_08139 [Phytophthora nicotianae]
MAARREVRSTRCSGCSGEFFWPASATQSSSLFPLLCGEIFCRECLAQKARVVLSSRVVPLRCCGLVVPHDFIREVLEHEEDVYYSFLMELPTSDARVKKGGATHKNMKTTTVSPLSARARSQVIDDEALPRQREITQPVTGSSKSTPVLAPAQPPGPRYRTRSSMARFAIEQDSKRSAVATTALPSATRQPPASPDPKFCAMCGSHVHYSRFKAPCGDEFCHMCIVTEVTRFLDAKSDDVAPASCCGKALPLDLVRRVITGPLLKTYAKRMSDYVSATTSTPSIRGTKRKAAPEKKITVATRGSKGKAPAKRVKTTGNEKQENERVCVACYSSVRTPSQWRVMPCGHGYCAQCLAKMAKASLTDRNQVPISCCSKEIPMDYVERALGKNQFLQYKRYLAERDPKTSTLQSDRDYATLVQKNHGKQCPQCGIGVLKIAGCNHITCPLGHYFCWECLETKCVCWKATS